MSEYVTFLVIGVTVGTVYGLSAMGLVLTYKTTGVFNFGHGAIGAGAAVIFYRLRDDGGLPAWLAAVLAIVVFGIVVGAAFEPIARRLAQVSTTYKVVATVGLIVKSSQRVYSVLDHQTWHWDAQAKRWWLESGLPDISPQQ